jgi:hypothetical protein
MSEVTGTPAEGAAPAPAPTESASSVDFSPVLDRVGELASTVGELQSGFQSFLQAQQPQAEEADPWAALMGEPEQDPYQQEPQGIDLQALQQTVEQRIQEGIQQGLSPLQAQMQQLTAERAREGLVAQHPQLKDPAIARETEQGMIAAYRAAGQPDEVIQHALSNPFLISQYIKAAEAEKLAQGQAPAANDVPVTESAGGATPGGDGTNPNPVHAAFQGRGRGLPSGFGGG